MTTTYVCMTVGGTDAESSAKGLLVNMPDVSPMIPNFAGTVAVAATASQSFELTPIFIVLEQPHTLALSARGDPISSTLPGLQRLTPSRGSCSTPSGWSPLPAG